MPKVGAHVSAAVSLEISFERAKHIGAETTQIFISPPQQWFQTKHDKEEIQRYKQAQQESSIGPNFIHGTYLINLGTDKEDHLKRSIEWLIYAMNLAGKLGVQGIIFHPGSHKGRGFEVVLPQIVQALETILKAETKVTIVSNVSEKPRLILENSAGAGGNIGGKFSELGQILKQVQDDRLKVALDTQHAFAAGYDIKTAAGLEKTLTEFDQEIGLSNLVAIHANDSKTELNSGKDRHENIGEGFIGRAGFANLLNHPKLADIPFILEVPGYASDGPDRDNIQTLKSLIKV